MIFIKKHFKFLIGLSIYVIASLAFILTMFTYGSDVKLRVASFLLLMPVIFYQVYFKTLTKRNLFAFYMIIGTFHFSLYAFSMELPRYEFLFQLVLLINLVATILAYSLIYFTIDPHDEDRKYYDIYQLTNPTPSDLKAISTYLDFYQPRVFMIFIEVIIVAILTAFIKNQASGVYTHVLLGVLFIFTAVFNIIWHHQKLKHIRVKKMFKIKQLCFLGLTTVLLALTYSYEDRFNIFLILTMIAGSLFYIQLGHYKWMTAELHDVLNLNDNEVLDVPTLNNNHDLNDTN